MTVLTDAPPEGCVSFDRKRLALIAKERSAEYAAATPYPHVVLDDFLGEPHASALAAAFPGPLHVGWKRRDYREQAGRLGQLQRTGFDGVHSSLKNLLAELNGMAFLDFLGALTGIRGLIPDPHFRGGGLSLTLPGGHLALHADFNRDRIRHLERKVTIIYYLGKDWQEPWGGALELWDEHCAHREKSYLPVLDRLIVMARGDTYFHGHPSPLTCPEGRFRASITAYYYVAANTVDEEEDAHGAIWVV